MHSAAYKGAVKTMAVLVVGRADLNKPANVRPTSASHNTAVWWREAVMGRASSVRVRVVRVRVPRIKVRVVQL